MRIAKIVALGACLGSSTFALADQSPGATKKNKTRATAPEVEAPQDTAPPAGTEADDTGMNRRDRKASEPTADDQKNTKSDVQLTAEIRRSIVKDKSLSTNARNVKIIAKDGVVTLKGPVASDAEKMTVEQKAIAVAGETSVNSELAVKP